jgi:hypothetical protein
MDDMNSSSHRMIIAVRCPAGASADIQKLWRHTLCALDGVRAEDEAKEAHEKLVGPFT